MSGPEEVAASILLKPELNNDPLPGENIIQTALRLKRQRLTSYHSVSNCLPTSVINERLFSTMLLVYSTLRKKLGTLIMQAIVFLKKNIEYWNERDVTLVMAIENELVFEGTLKNISLRLPNDDDLVELYTAGK